MKVRNATKEDLVVTPVDYPTFEVEAGKTSEDLPDEVAKSLLAQPDNWQPEKSSSAKDKE